MWLWGSAEAASTTEIAEAIASCGALTTPLPALDEAGLTTLAEGQVLRLLFRAADDQPSTAIGLAVLKGTKEELWVAAQDPHAVVDPTLHEFVVSELGPDHALWYGHMDLPRPIRDRQWVVESSNDHALAARTANRCWEHHWKLRADQMEVARKAVADGIQPAVTIAMMDDALVTPMNQGAWTFVSLAPDRTLVAYQATTVVGGAIPDWLVAELARSRLEEVLRSLEERAGTWAHGHYVAGHEPLLGPDGVAVPPLHP